MSRQSTFSVGIPTYNQAEFLEETILSLLNQTRPPDEIVVSDHYSTDNTQEVLRRYEGRIRAVQPPPGVNLARQYDFTLRSQSCDWITLLSSDDVAYPNFCQILERGAARREDAVLVRAGWDNINRKGQVLSRNYMFSVPRAENPPDNVLSQKSGPKVSFAAFALRRQAYLSSGPILESLESLADWALFVQVAPFGSFIYENELISGYRVDHPGNKFRKRIGMWIRDEQRVFYEVMPLAAERARMRNREWIHEASHKNFLRYLAAASRQFPATEREQIVPLFEPWAVRVGAEPELTMFADGETIGNPVNFIQRAKALVRPIVQDFYYRWQRV